MPQPPMRERTLIAVQHPRALAVIRAMLSGGVDLFFVISGFILFQATAGKAVRPGAFIRARRTRIVPLYGLALRVAMSHFPLARGSAPPALRDITLSCLFLPCVSATGVNGPFYNPGWTLNVERFFDALFAASLWWRGSPSSPRAGWD